MSYNVSQPLMFSFLLFIHFCSLPSSTSFCSVAQTKAMFENSNLFTLNSFYLICHGLLDLITFKSLT